MIRRCLQGYLTQDFLSWLAFLSCRTITLIGVTVAVWGGSGALGFSSSHLLLLPTIWGFGASSTQREEITVEFEIIT